jgi:BMFP domain-containing protein YqiC
MSLRNDFPDKIEQTLKKAFAGMDPLTRGELNAQVLSLKRTKQRIEELANLTSELETKLMS